MKLTLLLLVLGMLVACQPKEEAEPMNEAPAQEMEMQETETATAMMDETMDEEMDETAASGTDCADKMGMNQESGCKAE
jgi:uncharacterized protein involved in copper resistance